MATFFDQFHATFTRLMPDFRLLKAGPHKTDPRAATSIVIASITLGLLLMLMQWMAGPAHVTAPIKSAGQVALPPAADKVTIVSGSSTSDAPCAEQTWPYIDRRCLTESTQKRPQPVSRAVEPLQPAIDPRSVATAPVIPPAPAITEPQINAAQDRNIAFEPAARMTNSDNDIMQDELDEEAVPMMPPPDQYRRERQRYANPGRQIERQFRQFSRQLFPRF